MPAGQAGQAGRGEAGAGADGEHVAGGEVRGGGGGGGAPAIEALRLQGREALAAATNNYALQFGWNELGAIVPGRRADILVVDGDPTESIWNARRISTLLMDGNVVDREGLLKPPFVGR